MSEDSDLEPIEESATVWTRPAALLPLLEGEVQVWRATVEEERPRMEAWSRLLDVAERERAARIRVGTARDEFVLGRGMLRVLIGAAMGQEARGLRFEVEEHGKPRIEAVKTKNGTAEAVEFNVSHSRGMVLVALCRDARVGVDVEWVDKEIEEIEVARGVFSAEEMAELMVAGEGEARRRVFYERWTRKEAVSKAHGAGLTLPLDGVVETGKRRGDFDIWRCGPECQKGSDGYFLLGLEVNRNFLAALALNKGDRMVTRLEATWPALLGQD